MAGEGGATAEHRIQDKATLEENLQQDVGGRDSEGFLNQRAGKGSERAAVLLPFARG